MLSPIQRGSDQEANQSAQSHEITQKKESAGSKSGQKPAIQAKQKTIQAKQKPIQAKQKPIQAKQTPVQRNGQKGTVQRNSPQGDDLKDRMSAKYKVDLSEYKEHPNSSFPGTVGADATIQGKDIHYGPGKFTEQNRKHEFGHAIDNTKNGTPKGDTVINGQSIDTTREKAAEKIENTPLPKSAEGETPTQLKQSGNSTASTQNNSPVQAKFTSGPNTLPGIRKGQEAAVLRLFKNRQGKYDAFIEAMNDKDNEYILANWLKSNGLAFVNAKTLTGHLVKSNKSRAKLQTVDSQRQLEKVEFNPSKEEIMGQWDDGFTESNPRSEDESQRFGFEYEIKHSSIPFEPGKKGKFKGRPFYEFAVKQGHKPVFEHKFLPVELHLDSQVGGALLEVVTKPLDLHRMEQVQSWLKNTLEALSSRGSYLNWLKKEFNQAAPSNVVKHIFNTLGTESSQNTLHHMPQVTTTHTADELASLKNFPTFMTAVGGGDMGREYKKLTQHNLQNAEDKDDFIVNQYLGGMKQYGQSADTEDKGKSAIAMVKHGAQQFDDTYDSEDTIDNNPPIVRMDKYTNTDYELAEKLRTRANKPAPVFKRGGKNAYVVEYRGGSGQNMPDQELGQWMVGNREDSTTEDLMKGALPPAYFSGKRVYEQLQKNDQMRLTKDQQAQLRLYKDIQFGKGKDASTATNFNFDESNTYWMDKQKNEDSYSEESKSVAQEPKKSFKGSKGFAAPKASANALDWYAAEKPVNNVVENDGNRPAQFTVKDVPGHDNNCLIFSLGLGATGNALGADAAQAIREGIGIKHDNFLDNDYNTVDAICIQLNKSVEINWWTQVDDGTVAFAGAWGTVGIGPAVGHVVHILNVGQNHFQLLLAQ